MFDSNHVQVDIFHVKNEHFLSQISYKIAMSSSLSLGVADQITITDKESTCRTSSCLFKPVPRPIFKTVRYEQNGESLLSVLDDKNRTIACLKRQLQNQKMQLTYYIKKELSRKKIEQLSESCTPQASEESLPVNLAINKFYRQSGIKTKLRLLHERMNRLDCKISNSLRDQEFVLRKIVSKLCDFVKLQKMPEIDFQTQFGSLITDPLHIDLFDKLLTATVSVRRKLDCFKICCDRVLIIEEERNAIAEQVYSLPVEQRINCNYLLGIQMEKVELENEIKRISRHNAASRHRIKELNVIEEILHNLQWELNRSFSRSEENCITRMLNKINSEARLLLETTKEQKRKFDCELSRTKFPEPNRVLFFINLASGRDKFEQNEFDRYGIKTEEEIRFFEMVKGEIDLLKKKMKEEAEKDVRKAKTDCDVLKRKVSDLFLDNTRTKTVNNALQAKLEELKLKQRDGMQSLKNERDAYKSQVEDLQAIREAYAQLVDKQPNGLQMERQFMQQIDERDKRILDLEKLVTEQNTEIEELKAKVADQHDQIVVLNRFINLTRPNSPRSEDECNEVNFDVKPCLSNTSSKISNNKTSKEEIKPNPIFLRCCRHGTGTKKHSKRSTKNASSSKRKIPSRSPNYLSSLQKLISTSLEALPQAGQESLRSIFHYQNRESRDLAQTTGNVKMEKSSVFSVEIKYKNSNMDDALFELNEYEDVSRESVVLENRYTKMSSPLWYN